MRQVAYQLQQVLDNGPRKPACKLYAWDPATVTMSQVVCAASNHDESLPAPLDLTPYASSISWSDRQLSFSLSAPSTLFHPDKGASRRYLADGAIIRLVEGDEAVPEEFWITTFTGQVHGQVGWKMSKKDLSITSKITVMGRAETPGYKKRQITSKEYTVGTDIGIALYDICETFLGLTAKEMRIPFTLGRQFKHKVNQLAQVTPWDGISALLEVVCYQPYFDGEGRLSYINKSLNRPACKLLSDDVPIQEREVPERAQDSPNKALVTFIDSKLSRVDGPYQKLGSAQVTTGFFSMHETLPCWWSEDHTQRAAGTSMKVAKSVNSGLLPVGTESYKEIDEFHGQIDVNISVWVPILATVMIGEYLAAAALPDRTSPNVIIVPGKGTALMAPPMGGTVFGVITVNPTTFEQSTISVGRIIQAQAMVAISLIMMSLGSAQYEIWGTPYDYAFLERQAMAIESGLEYWQENQIEIKNDFIGTMEQADTVAVTNLIWEKSQSYPRRVVLLDDPRLELGDIIGLPDGRKLVITALSKNIKRGEVPLLTVEGGKVLTT